MNDNVIIGLTGRFGAGCTTTSYFLEKELNFKYFSLSEALKEKAKNEVKDFLKREEKEKRKILQNLGDELRKKNLVALALPIIRQIKKQKLKNVVIDSMRNPAEIKAFKDKLNNFFLIAIDAEAETRWKRLEDIYKKDRDKFDIDDKRDAGDDQPEYGQKVKKCIELADILINNEVNFYEDKEKKNDKAIDEYGQKMADYVKLMCEPGSRQPMGDEIYMHHACSVALWSACLKRQVGAVIVIERHINSGYSNEKNKKKEESKEKESYVVATGCNNVPIGEEPCKEKCYRDYIKEKYLNTLIYCRKCGSKLQGETHMCKKCEFDNSALPGKLLDLCRSVHAEEAAILQAAKLGGPPIEGAKLYTSLFPCMLCCKKIINTGIKSVIYLESYPMEESLAIRMFRKCKINVSKYEGVSSITFNMLFKRHF